MVVRGKLEDVPLLEVLQVLAYSAETGALMVDGGGTEGAVLFDRGAIVCAESSSTRALLSKAARQTNPQNRRAFQRVQALATLTELLSLSEGTFRFERREARTQELGGVDLAPFYASGPMATAELLLVLATSIDKKDEPPAVADTHAAPASDHGRAHPRYSPTIIEAELRDDGTNFRGYLTNVSAAGAFFHGEALPEVDRLLTLRFELPGGCGMITTEARVAWARTDPTGGERGVGLALETLGPEDERKLGLYLDRFQKLVTDKDLVG